MNEDKNNYKDMMVDIVKVRDLDSKGTKGITIDKKWCEYMGIRSGDKVKIFIRKID